MIKEYYYSLFIMNDIEPELLDGEKFDVLKLLSTVELNDLKPHLNTIADQLLHRFENTEPKALLCLMETSKNIKKNFLSLSNFIPLVSINSLCNEIPMNNKLQDYNKRY